MNKLIKKLKDYAEKWWCFDKGFNFIFLALVTLCSFMGFFFGWQIEIVFLAGITAGLSLLTFL